MPEVRLGKFYKVNIIESQAGWGHKVDEVKYFETAINSAEPRMKTLPIFSTGETCEGKTKDCSVRALANVTLMEYEEAEQVLSEWGRKPNKGAFRKTIINACLKSGLKKIEFFGNSAATKDFIYQVPAAYIHNEDKQKGITLGNFLKTHSKGRFYVLYSGHALAVVDGKIVDTIGNLANRRVIACFSKL